MLKPDETVVMNQTKMVWESFLLLPTDDTDKGVVFDCLRRINDIVLATAVRHRGMPPEVVKPPAGPVAESESSIARAKRINLAKIGVVKTPDTETVPHPPHHPAAPASQEPPVPGG